MAVVGPRRKKRKKRKKKTKRKRKSGVGPVGRSETTHRTRVAVVLREAMIRDEVGLLMGGDLGTDATNIEGDAGADTTVHSAVVKRRSRLRLRPDPRSIFRMMRRWSR